MRQPVWDIYETVILIDSFYRMQAGDMTRREAIKYVSDALRKRAINRGLKIDQTFRNGNGINMRFEELTFIDSNSKKGLRNTSKLFRETIKLYKKDRDSFDSVLKKALVQVKDRDFSVSEIITDETDNDMNNDPEFDNQSVDAVRDDIDYYFDSLNRIIGWLETRYTVKLSYNYREINDMLYKVYREDKEILWVYFIYSKKSHYISIETEPEYLSVCDVNSLDCDGIQIRESHPQQKIYFTRFERITEALSTICQAITDYLNFEKDGSSKDIPNFCFKDDMCDSQVLNNAENSLAKTSGVDKEIVISAEQRKKNFSDWMWEKGMAAATIRPYVSAVGIAGDIAFERGFIPANVFEIEDVELLKDAIRKLMDDTEFIEMNDVRHNQCRASWIKYINFSGDPSFSAKDITVDKSDYQQVVCKDSEILYRRLKSMASVYDDVAGHDLEWIRKRLGLSIELNELKAALDEIPWVFEVENGVYSFSKNATPLVDFDKVSLTKVLMLRYQNGMQFDSIDLEIFRETYLDIIGEELDLSDKQLMTCLCKSGVLYKGRLFPAEGIISESAKEKLMKYIENSFSKGKQVLYYKAIYSDLADVFAYCFNLTDAMMLKPYLECVCNPDEFFFTDEYVSKENGVIIDHSSEVENYMLAMGKPLSYGDVYEGLSHLSQDIIYGVIKNSPNIIMNEKEHYYHYGIFEFSSEDADMITDYINSGIEEDGYCIWSLVYDRIQETMPLFIENNVYLSSLGIRNAVARKLSGRFHFDGEVICRRGESLSMADVYRLYGEHHTPFSDDDLYCFSKKVNGGVIYFDSLSETAARVDKNLFVSKKDIDFDIEATDSAISTYLETGYMFVKDIDSFLVFPTVGYEWNEFLLETYLMYFSKKYALYNNGRSLNNVAGAVVRRNSGYDDFSDVCADALAKSECELKKDKALDYLGEVNLLTRRSYRKIDSVLVKARHIRNRKE